MLILLFSSACTWNNWVTRKFWAVGSSETSENFTTIRWGNPPKKTTTLPRVAVKSWTDRLSRVWESNRSSGTQQTLRILWHPMTHRRLQKAKRLVPVLSQMNPVHSRRSIILSGRSQCFSVLQQLFASSSACRILQQKSCINFTSLSYVLHAKAFSILCKIWVFFSGFRSGVGSNHVSLECCAPWLCGRWQGTCGDGENYTRRT
jgi:hypothetical protein